MSVRVSGEDGDLAIGKLQFLEAFRECAKECSEARLGVAQIAYSQRGRRDFVGTERESPELGGEW